MKEVLSFFLHEPKPVLLALPKKEERNSAPPSSLTGFSRCLSLCLSLSFILLCFLICCLLSSCLARCFLFPHCGESYVTLACLQLCPPPRSLSLPLPFSFPVSFSHALRCSSGFVFGQNELKFNKLPILLFSFLRIFVVSIDIGHDLRVRERNVLRLFTFTFFACWHWLSSAR